MASQDGDIKVISGISPTFIVDGFNFCLPECKTYFLTHCHSDHTTGLHAGFDLGTIYCTEISAAIVVSEMGLSPKVVQAVPLLETVTIEGVDVTFVDANHCPGSVLIHFHDPTTGKRILHTGDFRAAKDLTHGPDLHDLLSRGPIDILYLDTTYNRPKHTFPPQRDILNALDRLVREELAREPRTLFIVGSYSIGKERAIEAVARAAKSPALVSARKARLLKLCQRDASLYTVEDGPDVCVRVAGAGLSTGHEGLAELHVVTEGRFAAIVAFRPTGWTYSPAQEAKGFQPWCEGSPGKETRVYGIPYSEHSSYTELQKFVARVKPKRIVPTVNAEHRDAEINRFVQHMDLSQDRGRMDAYLIPPGLSKRAAGKRPMSHPVPCLDRVNVEEQRRLWEQATSASSTPVKRITSSLWSSSGSSHDGDDQHGSIERREGERIPDNGACAAVGAVSPATSLDDATLTQLQEVVGGPVGYLQGLLRDSGGSVEDAIAIHFGANGGSVPTVPTDTPSHVVSSSSPWVSSAVTNNDGAAACNEGGQSSNQADDDAPFPDDMVVTVFGDDRYNAFRLFESREKVEIRLRQLGACVMKRKGKHTTHCIVPLGTKRSRVPKLDATVTLHDESWLFRHVQRWKDSGATPRPVFVPKSIKLAPSSKRRRVGQDHGGGATSETDVVEEVRGCVTRKATADKLQRVARALSDRLYLIRWVDRTTQEEGDGHACGHEGENGHACGHAWPRHEFTVLGSTGNVYHCEISREPRCDCKDAAKGNICKHLYFIYCRVLGVDQHASHVPFQRRLLRSELNNLFRSPPLVASSVMANADVQRLIDSTDAVRPFSTCVCVCAWRVNARPSVFVRVCACWYGNTKYITCSTILGFARTRPYFKSPAVTLCHTLSLCYSIVSHSRLFLSTRLACRWTVAPARYMPPLEPPLCDVHPRPTTRAPSALNPCRTTPRVC
eukprot:m.87854 g.87854  ORF g.87854 m.87854 type:complete len:952 (+) comp9728_c0_seq1:293-3148(+)